MSGFQTKAQNAQVKHLRRAMTPPSGSFGTICALIASWAFQSADKPQSAPSSSTS
jgi:hypothetical protein